MNQKIAVIGMHVNAPGAPDLESFRQIIQEGREVVSFFSDEELDAAGVPRATREVPCYVAAGATLPDIEMFDAGFFSVNPVEAAVMDPQLRRLLEAASSVLETAGYDPKRLNVPVGVYAGSANSTYLLSNLRDIVGQGGPRAAAALQFNERDSLCTFVCYKLDLKGPGLSVQTNCSTSLVAVHLACQGLQLGECDMALAGGVSISVHQAKGYFHERDLYFSPDGHTRPFDARAKGTVFGSGLGLVVLKRLDDAIRDGDNIHAIIAGSALSNDGGIKAAFTAPNVAGQVSAIAGALAAAGVTADSIGYVETHGTGTPLGDSIEIEALTRVFRRHSSKRTYCCLGSAKGNFGHLDKAAGIIGLIKACLVVEHGELPPTVNFQTPNPHLRLDSSPFYLRTDAGEWRTDGVPRRAGVSAFGIGGTNAHVILEQAPSRMPTSAASPAHLLTWSARTPGALETLTDSLATALDDVRCPDLADAAYVSHVGRTAFPFRRIVVSDDCHDAARSMRARQSGRVYTSKTSGERDVVFMFPGGETSYRGSVREIFRAEPVFRSHIEQAHALLEKTVAIDLVGVLTSPRAEEESSPRRPDDISTALVALFSVEYSLARLLMHWGIQPKVMIGHSLGEYVAACLAGVFTFEDALRLLVRRGQLMATTSPGAMLAVLSPDSEVRHLLSGDIQFAAINTDTQCVVSGSVDSIHRVEAQLAASGIDCHLLNVGVASHSPLMRPVVPALTEAVSLLSLHPPTIPFISGATGTWITNEDAVRPGYWGEHLTQTVRFNDGLTTIGGHKSADDSAILIEVSTGVGLANLARGRFPSSEPGRVMALMRRSFKEQDDRSALLEGLGSLWLRGAPVDWERFHQHEHRRRVSLPTYPFERSRYWVEAGGSGAPPLHDTESERRNEIANWFYLPSWRQTLLPPSGNSRGADETGSQCVLLLAADTTAGLQLARELTTAGATVVLSVPGAQFGRSATGVYRLDITRDEDYVEVFDDLKRRDLVPAQIVHCLSLNMAQACDASTFERAQDQGLYSLLALVRVVVTRSELVRARISIICSKVNSIGANDEVWPERSVLAPVCRVISQEYPTLFSRIIEIAEEGSGERDSGWQTALVAAEILSAGKESVVAYRGAHRWVRHFEPIAIDKPPAGSGPWKKDCVYLITGGAGRIGLAMAEHILSCADATVILTGRKMPSPSERIRKLRSRGARIHLMEGDVSEADRMIALIAEVRERFSGLHGVIHGAGITGGEWFLPMSAPDNQGFEAHFRPKVHGLYVLERVLAGIGELEFCLLLSSLSSHLGGLGHASYAAANAFMDAFARARAHIGQPRWISAEMELWSFDGHPVNSEAGGSYLGASLEGLRMTPLQAGEALDRVLTVRTPELAVSTVNLNDRYRKWAVGEVVSDPVSPPASQQPVSQGRTHLEKAYVAPRTPTEQHLATVWAKVLGFAEIGVEDDFFRLGGDSLAAIRIVARLRDTLGTEVSVTDMLKNPSIARLSDVISGRSAVSPVSGDIAYPLK